MTGARYSSAKNSAAVSCNTHERHDAQRANGDEIESSPQPRADVGDRPARRPARGRRAATAPATRRAGRPCARRTAEAPSPRRPSWWYAKSPQFAPVQSSQHENDERKRTSAAAGDARPSCGSARPGDVASSATISRTASGDAGGAGLRRSRPRVRRPTGSAPRAETVEVSVNRMAERNRQLSA